MGIDAEKLLMSTGLVNEPDETAILASRTILDELEDQLLEALDRDEPKKLKVIPRPKTYLSKLPSSPPYEDWMENILEPTLGLDEAGAYQLAHQDARRILLEKYPNAAVDRLSGTIPVNPDPVKEGIWYLLVDTVENQRIASDLASCSILPAAVDLFSELFPESYQYLGDSLRLELAHRGIKYRPPWWLESALRVFLKAPNPKPIPPPKPPKPEVERKAEIDTEELKP